MAIAIDKIREEFGALVDWREDDVTASLSTTAKIIARNNPDRLQLTIMNLSSINVFIRPSQAPTSTTGILLSPSGGFFSVSVKDDGPLPILEWQAIGASGTPDIYTLEVLGVESLT